MYSQAFCCEELHAAFRAHAIDFGAHILTEKEDCFLSIRYWECWPEGPTCTAFKITFCPFCGEAIMLKQEPTPPEQRP